MFGYALDFTPAVEQTSMDEGYFDLSAVRKPPAEVAQTIRRAIWQKLKLSVSEGIGSNKLVSAVASKLHKPAAFEEVPAGREADFLAPLRNQWLPGVGPKLGQQLNAAGLAHIGQLAGTPVELLELMVGRQALTRTPKLSRERAQRTLRDRAGEGLALENCHPVRLLASSLTVRPLRPFAAIPLRSSGLMLRQFARGIDERPVVSARTPAKSFSQQKTFAADVTDEEFAQATLRRMVDMTCC